MKLMENGAAVEYLVVNQGRPSNSTYYDESCDGVWLMRKDCPVLRQFYSSDVNDYANGVVNSYLNGDFFNTLGTAEQIAVKQVKIPYVTKSGTVMRQGNGLSCKVFLPSCRELGFNANSNFYDDGQPLEYFNGISAPNALLIANWNGAATEWWQRSPKPDSTTTAWTINQSGGATGATASNWKAVRPTLVIDKSVLFDKNTLVLKGAA